MAQVSTDDLASRQVKPLTVDLESRLASRPSQGLYVKTLQTFKKNRAAVYSCWVLLAIFLFVWLAPFFLPFDYIEHDHDAQLLGPSWSTRHFFGTDELGRDLLARVAIGGRISLAVGFLAATIAMTFGTIYGAMAGYVGGLLDTCMMRFVEALDALPFILFVIILTTFFGQSLLLFFIAIGMLSWINIARIVRAQVLGLKQKAFIEAAIVTGCSRQRIIFRHLLPNVLGVVVIYASMMVGNMILSESVLSFLGLGIQEPMTSWGVLLKDGARLIQVQAWPMIFPGAFLVLTLFCLNFIGDGLRDALDPKMR